VAIRNNILKDSMDDELSNVQCPNLPTIGYALPFAAAKKLAQKSEEPSSASF